MSLGIHLGRSLLFLILSVNVAVFMLNQHRSYASAEQNSSDQEEIHALTERYASAIAAGDLDAMRQFWDPQSPNMATRFKFYQSLFAYARIEFASVNLTRLEVTGDKAVSNLTVDERRLYKKTGAPLSQRGAYDGLCLSFGWIKTAAGWKIESEVLVQEELATRLDAAASRQEIDEILEKEKNFVTSGLVIALAFKCDRRRPHADFDKTLRCYQLEQTIAESIGYQEGIADSLIGIGAMRDRQDEGEQALPFFQRALALYETAGSKHGQAFALERLANSYIELGDYQKAFECANKSLRLYDELKNLRGKADALIMMAYVYDSQNNFQQALACYEKASLIFQELGDYIQSTILRFRIVRKHVEVGNYDQALDIYQDLLKLMEHSGDSAGASEILSSIGQVYAMQGRRADAREYYIKSLQEAEASKDNFTIALALIQSSGIYLAEGKYADAAPLAERAVSLTRQTSNQDTLSKALTSVGYCQLGLNHHAEARRAFEEAASIIEQLRAQTAGGTEDRQLNFESGLNTYHGMLSLLAQEGKIPEAITIAERAKARALLDTLQQGRVSVQKAMTADEQEQERRLMSEMARLNTRLIAATQSDKPDAGRIGEIKSQLEKARSDFGVFQTSLYATRPELKVQRGEAPIIKAEELTAMMPDASSALLEYAVTNDKTYLFAVTKATDKAQAEIQLYTLPIKRDDLAGKIEAFRRQLADRDLGFRESAGKLYELLLKPAEARIQGKNNLIIAPDDKLWEMPFQALLTRPNRFLIESAAIAYAPSLTALREMGRRRKNQNKVAAPTKLLALGNPLLNLESAGAADLALRGGKLDPLPEAEEEVNALGRYYGATRSKIYVGAEATENRVKAEAGQAGIIHFATHGTLNDAAPMYSYLALARGDKNDDGLLEAWELMRMDLRADLVVLSACETARGRFGAGEGVIGLTWALFVAGVPSTVVSQWKVESASARDLMLGFHQRLLGLTAASKEKMTKAEALRQSALKLLKNPATSHPFYWAGFVLVGDGE